MTSEPYSYGQELKFVLTAAFLAYWFPSQIWPKCKKGHSQATLHLKSRLFGGGPVFLFWWHGAQEKGAPAGTYRQGWIRSGKRGKGCNDAVAPPLIFAPFIL